VFLPHLENLCRSRWHDPNVWDPILRLLWSTIGRIEYGQAILTLREDAVTEVLTNALQEASGLTRSEYSFSTYRACSWSIREPPWMLRVHGACSESSSNWSQAVHPCPIACLPERAINCSTSIQSFLAAFRTCIVLSRRPGGRLPSSDYG
jgi:hypothetical protein